MQVIVAQLGARLQYAVPRMLDSHGKLERLYTDFCVEQGAGRLLFALQRPIPRILKPKGLLRLPRRTVEGVPARKIFVVDRLLLEHLRQQLFPRDTAKYTHYVNEIFGQHMIKMGLGNATAVYTMFGEGMPFVQFAQSQGLKIIVDVFINPVAHHIVKTEQELFSDWEDETFLTQSGTIEERVSDFIELADLLLCPSSFVTEGLRHYPNFDEKKVRLVPYSSGVSYGSRINQPIQGRVLFAGSAGLRKGIHYLAQAANICFEHGRQYDFRIAGAVTDKIRQHPVCSNLTFKGLLPKKQMIEEFLTADVFVLPSLAEGSAAVVYEALAAGVPVVTTHSTGSVVTNGREGLIVPERDPQALADAIQSIIESRTLRETMATNARATAHEYTEEKVSIQLLRALEQ